MSDFSQFDDIDPTETREWLESIDSVLKNEGAERAHFLLNKIIDFARRSGAYLPYKREYGLPEFHTGRSTAGYPGDRAVEKRLEAYMRWNAMAMVRAGQSREHRIRRAHLELRVLGDHVRSRLQSFLARGHRGPGRRHGLYPGSFGARHLCARVPRGAAERSAARIASGRKSAAADCRPIPIPG